MRKRQHDIDDVDEREGGERCINPEKVAHFWKFMLEDAEELEQAVRQGTNLKATYEQFVENIRHSQIRGGSIQRLVRGETSSHKRKFKESHGEYARSL